MSEQTTYTEDGVSICICVNGNAIQCRGSEFYVSSPGDVRVEVRVHIPKEEFREGSSVLGNIVQCKVSMSDGVEEQLTWRHPGSDFQHSFQLSGFEFFETADSVISNDTCATAGKMTVEVSIFRSERLPADNSAGIKTARGVKFWENPAYAVRKKDKHIYVDMVYKILTVSYDSADHFDKRREVDVIVF